MTQLSEPASAIETVVTISLATRRRQLLKAVDPDKATRADVVMMLDLLGDLIDESETWLEERSILRDRLAEIARTLHGHASRIEDAVDADDFLSLEGQRSVPNSKRKRNRQ